MTLKNILCVILLFVVFCCVAGEDVPSSLLKALEYQTDSHRIVGGREAQSGELPFQVAIQRKYYFGGGSFQWCGGSIIDSEHVLTAGHCVSGVPTAELIVFAGVLNKTWQSEETGKVARNVTDVYLHEDFVYETYLNDIAVIKVSPPFPEDNPAVKAISLRQNIAPAGINCTVSGWGLMGDGTQPDKLQVVLVPFIPPQQCRQIYIDANYTEETIAPGMNCAGYSDGGKDACGGDSGGPLQCGGFLTGVVSWGVDCALPSYPGVYADVAFYKDWIATQVDKSRATSWGIRQLTIPIS